MSKSQYPHGPDVTMSEQPHGANRHVVHTPVRGLLKGGAVSLIPLAVNCATLSINYTFGKVVI
jgi:hypothetical protein